MVALDQGNESDEQRSAPSSTMQPSRWLIGLHMFGGGMLFNAFQISQELPDLGGIPLLILLALGYFGSMAFVRLLWKKVTKKSYRIWIGLSLIPTYAVMAGLMAWTIDKILM